MEYQNSEYRKSEFETQSSIFEDQGIVYDYNKAKVDESNIKNPHIGLSVKPRNEEDAKYSRAWRTNTEEAVKSLEALNYE